MHINILFIYYVFRAVQFLLCDVQQSMTNRNKDLCLTVYLLCGDLLIQESINEEVYNFYTFVTKHHFVLGE